mmetsp:Transcript_12165/g.34814  ORF Transcript_12165/g.34814 Transcript_12165/m.34814 type:complete len:301 (-) Transcript_12165:60-962(-)
MAHDAVLARKAQTNGNGMSPRLLLFHIDLSDGRRNGTQAAFISRARTLTSIVRLCIAAGIQGKLFERTKSTVGINSNTNLRSSPVIGVGFLWLPSFDYLVGVHSSRLADNLRGHGPSKQPAHGGRRRRFIIGAMVAGVVASIVIVLLHIIVRILLRSQKLPIAPLRQGIVFLLHRRRFCKVLIAIHEAFGLGNHALFVGIGIVVIIDLPDRATEGGPTRNELVHHGDGLIGNALRRRRRRRVGVGGAVVGVGISGQSQVRLVSQPRLIGVDRRAPSVRKEGRVIAPSRMRSLMLIPARQG